MRVLVCLCLSATFAGCGTTERLVQQPVPVRVEVPTPIQIPAELLIQREPTEIALGDFEGFSGVTYGDALILWARDRETIKTLNGQLQAIEDLNESAQE